MNALTRSQPLQRARPAMWALLFVTLIVGVREKPLTPTYASLSRSVSVKV